MRKSSDVKTLTHTTADVASLCTTRRQATLAWLRIGRCSLTFPTPAEPTIRDTEELLEELCVVDTSRESCSSSRGRI